MKQFCCLMLVFLMSGCSGKEEPVKIFEPQIESIDKARQVENLVLDRMDQQNKELDKFTQ